MKEMRAAPVADESVGALLSRVVSDAEQVARSEIALQKTRLLAKVDEARAGVVLALAAMLLGSLALIGLVVGAVLSLATLVGPLGATGIVVGVLMVTASLCGWLALRHFKAIAGAGSARP